RCSSAVTPALQDFTARLLLRYLRTGRSAAISVPQLNFWEDVDFLRLYWCVSPPVLELCEYLNANRHEVQSSLGERARIDDAVVRGRLDSRRTLLERAISGYRTRVVFAEPMRSFTSGPNHVLVWVLQRAHLLLSRFTSEASFNSRYPPRFE